MIDLIMFIVKNWPAIVLTTTLIFLILVLYRIFNSNNTSILTGDPTDDPSKVNKLGGFFGDNKQNTGISLNAVNEVQVDGFSNYNEYNTDAHNPEVMKNKGNSYLSSPKGCSSLPDQVCKWHPEYRDVCVWAVEKNSEKGKCVPATLSGAPLNTTNIEYWCGKTGKLHYKGSKTDEKDDQYKNITTCQGHSKIM